MADKLSEATWTVFAKKQKLELEDKALVKALAAFDKSDESKPEARLKTLEEVIKQIPEQVKALVKRKKELGDKPFGLVKDQLYSLLEEAEALLKKTQAAIAAAEGDDEADTPVLLTTKMVPLLRELRKGEVQMHAMICTAGKNTAVLIMRRAISASRRKLLAEAVDAKGGMKSIVGECVFENKALTFVVQSPAAQLAKRLRQALLDQTEMRIKVRVRGEDGVEDEDLEDEGEEQPGVQPQKPSAPAGGPASAGQIAYTQRLRKVRERYEQALKEQHAESTKLRALMGFASEKADERKDYAAAIKALESLEKLLDGSAPAASAQTREGLGGADTAAAFKTRMTALVPRLKAAQAAGLPAAQDAKLKVSEAAVLAGKRAFERAGALLDEVETLLGGGVGLAARGAAASAAADSAGAGEAGTWASRLPQAQRRFTELMRTVPADASALRTAMAYATEHAEAGSFTTALAALDRLERLMSAAEGAAQAGAAGGAGSETPREGLVKYRSALIGLRDSVDAVKARIDQLARAVPESMPDESAMAVELKGAIVDIADELLEVVDDAIEVSEDPRSPVTKRLESLLREAMQQALNHPLVHHVDENPFGVDVRAGETLKKALAEVLEHLPASA
jgi:hypothetical protein